MFLSMPIKGGEKWDTDPTSGMIADNRVFTAGQKLPQAYFFEGLVRQCLLNYLKENSMSQIVFAYGSNMCAGRFRDYGVHPEGVGRPALLSGYRLLFNKESTDGSGKANVETHQGSDTWGVLYTIPHADLRILDAGEVGYRRVQLPVGTADNATHQAWVYVAIAPGNAGLRPYSWYKRFLVEGARDHHLEAAYIADLENIDAVQDANAARDRRKRALTCQTQP